MRKNRDYLNVGLGQTPANQVLLADCPLYRVGSRL